MTDKVKEIAERVWRKYSLEIFVHGHEPFVKAVSEFHAEAASSRFDNMVRELRAMTPVETFNQYGESDESYSIARVESIIAKYEKEA